MKDQLKDSFLDLCRRSDPVAPALGFWEQIEEQYTNPKRHYHNLTHLANVLHHLDQCRHLIDDWDCILFAIFFHDYIYKVSNNDNEERSAEEARSKLVALKLSPAKINIVTEMILATKGHDLHQNQDVNYFTDADLSILGASRDDYNKYTKDVRKEYSIYPDILYKPGRKKVLRHFLAMPYLFKTDFFRGRLEGKARENISWELETLT